LLVHIVHTEDAARYQGPVRFWNSQLNEVLGFNSPKLLNNARAKAVASGWLVYDRDHVRAVGHYFTTVPTSVQRFDDEPIEPVIIPSMERKEERVAEQITTQERNDSRPIKGTEGVKQIRLLTDDRKKKLRARLRNPAWPWRDALKKLPLAGDGWQPDFDWFISNEGNAFKILEGKYDWRAGKTQSSSSSPAPVATVTPQQEPPHLKEKRERDVRRATEAAGGAA